MKLIGNFLWFLFGGIFFGLLWCIYGCLWCISIVGIPIGLQCFKFAKLTFFPFGKQIEYGGGIVSLLANIIWIVTTGVPMAIGNATWGLILCLTIVGIPFGKQFFKLAKLSLFPFGSSIR
ncbi:MAG: YccF domain-containing protein [Bacillota bacterium]|nr:YccF domain-containing protein [Bacillota bacterium]